MITLYKVSLIVYMVFWAVSQSITHTVFSVGSNIGGLLAALPTTDDNSSTIYVTNHSVSIDELQSQQPTTLPHIPTPTTALFSQIQIPSPNTPYML